MSINNFLIKKRVFQNHRTSCYQNLLFRNMEKNRSILWMVRQKTFVSEVEVGIPCPLTTLYKVNVIALYKESIQCFVIVLIKKNIRPGLFRDVLLKKY